MAFSGYNTKVKQSVTPPCVNLDYTLCRQKKSLTIMQGLYFF